MFPKRHTGAEPIVDEVNPFPTTCMTVPPSVDPFNGSTPDIVVSVA